MIVFTGVDLTTKKHTTMDELTHPQKTYIQTLALKAESLCHDLELITLRLTGEITQQQAAFCLEANIEARKHIDTIIQQLWN